MVSFIIIRAHVYRSATEMINMSYLFNPDMTFRVYVEREREGV